MQCLIDGERVHVAGGRARARLRHTRSAHPAGPRDKRRPAPDRLAAAPCCPPSPTVLMPRGTPDPKTTTIAAAPTYAKTGRAGRRNRTRGIPPHRTCWTGRSRSSSGAEMTCDLIIWSATLRAEMAVLRVTCRTRSDSTIPSRGFGVTVLIWANAACAAFSASMVSSLPRRRRSDLSGAVTSRTSSPALSTNRSRPAP